MRVAIVDDEKYWRECIQSEIAQYDIKEEKVLFIIYGGVILCLFSYYCFNSPLIYYNNLYK